MTVQRIHFRQQAFVCPPVNVKLPHQQASIPFAGQKPSQTGSFWQRLLLLLPLAGLAPACTYQVKQDPPQQEIGWHPQAKVLASSTDTGYSYWATYPYGMYTYFLNRELKKPEIKSLEEAHQALVKSGLPVRLLNIQQPTQTPRTLGGWQKDDKKTKRFILMFAHKGRFSNDLDIMRKRFAKTFEVPQSNIFEYAHAKPKDFEEGLALLNGFIQHYQGEPVDVLIYYSGHGGWRDPDHKSFEGGRNGYLSIGLHEEKLKKLVNDMLAKKRPNVRVYIMLDTCFAGAWIAQNPELKGDLEKES